jgi:hypothetical protein
MAQKQPSLPKSSTLPATSTSASQLAISGQTPTTLPDPTENLDLNKFRETKDAQRLIEWVRSEHMKAASARTAKVQQWRMNLFMFFGNQWVERTRTELQGIRDTFTVPKTKDYRARRTINKTRSFVRSEHSKFLSSIPQAIAVPATAEDQDVRSAYAAEQAWLSISERQKLRRHFTKASWWTITTGIGFLKTWWDPKCVPDPTDPMNTGDITFGAISPFNLFVPDLSEQEIEDQAYIITAYKKPISWVKYFYGQQLQNVDLTASQSGGSSLLEEGVLNLSAGSRVLDSVTVYEAWLKPGAHELLPDGGIVILVEDNLVGIYREGLPYKHNQYPFAKLEHIPNSTFYADSPLVDTNYLQKEYNEWRTRLGVYVKRMSAPQYAAPKGSIIPAKMTDEPGLVVEYTPGMQPPTPLQISPIPQYVMDQGQMIQSDWEEITGQYDASRGQAPAGVTAGTAINYLQEKGDQFLTPEYQSIEDVYEKIAGQTLSLFQQYVDMPRKIKTVGADGSFDTLELDGATIGLDIRIQRGSAVGQSQAAKQAFLMDLWSSGVITDPNLLLKMLEVGGTQKVLDMLNVAQAKAIRENTKMKMLTDAEIQQHLQLWEQEQALQPPMPQTAPAMPGQPPAAPDPNDPAAASPTGPVVGPPEPSQAQGPGPIIPVDQFDVHAVHIDTHNKFRMGQEYETLSPAVKDQFDQHVKMHEELQSQVTLQKILASIPDASADPSNTVPLPGGQPPQGGASMSANGAVPAPDLSTATQGASDAAS